MIFQCHLTNVQLKRLGFTPEQCHQIGLGSCNCTKQVQKFGGVPKLNMHKISSDDIIWIVDREFKNKNYEQVSRILIIT